MVNFTENKGIEVLCRTHQVSRLELFGSMARGEAQGKSDFDFLVQFQPMPPEEYSTHFFGLLHDLEDCLKRPVDLLTWDSVKSESLKKSISRDTTLVYEG